MATKMKIAPETQNLARRLLAHEASADPKSEATAPVTLRVYEKLRGNLHVLAGVAGFQSLSSRALTLASLQIPSLRAVQVAADGRLQEISEIDSSHKADEIWTDENGIIFISGLVELLLMFLGEALTMNLIRNVWPDAAFDNGNPRDGRKA